MKKLQFGMPTLIETKTLEECAALCRKLGLDFVELNMNLPEYQIENIDEDYFADIADKYGIYYIIHLDENLNVCDFNKRIANAYIETVLQTIELAKKLRIPVLNMHMAKGVYFTLPNEKVYLFSEYEELYLQNLTAFRDKCEKAIGNYDIKICIENSSGYDKAFLQKGLNLLLKSPAFALTFDIGHNAGIGGGDEAVIMEYADKFCCGEECNNRLYHMHIHDANSIGKDHLPLGDGELDLLKYFNMASKYNCRVVLETKTSAGLKKSVEWVKSKVWGDVS